MAARSNATDWWQAASPHLDQLFDLPATERTEWIAALRERDPELAELLSGLVDEHELLEREHFLEGAPPSAAPFPGASLAGQALGVYTLVAPIGEGGMGSVWLATRNDGRFERRAAVKLLRVALSGRGGEDRFRREGRILARLTHPHVAALLDAGVAPTGQPYLVLEHVDGTPIDRYCDDRRLDVESRVRLVLDVLAAVAHAHAQLVVHRDLKPSNVLVRVDGCVKLLDFGIAKLLEDEAGTIPATQLTQEWGSALTPQYAAPEQAAGEPVTTATDVYALGVLLFQLLSGQHPAGPSAQAPAHFLKAALEADAPRPSTVVGTGRDADAARLALDRAQCRGTTPERLARRLRGDLDTIVTKALKRQPAERYASVAALADDLRRVLAHEPITARPDSLRYRAGKLIRRNPTAAALATLAVSASLAGVAGTASQARRARSERDFALRQLARAEAINDLNAFVLSDAAPSGKPFTVNELLARAERVVAGQQEGADPQRVDLLISIGRQYSSQDEQRRAREVLERAYALSQRSDEPATRARAACALASIVSRDTGPPRAEELIAEGLAALDDERAFALDRVFCLQCAAEVTIDHGAARDAVAAMEEAQQLLAATPLRSKLLELRLFMGLAEAYRAAGRNREAATSFERAAERLSALGRADTQTAGTLYNNWGLALYVLGRPREAEAQMRRAIALSSSGDDEQSVSSMLLLNEARVLRKLARYEEAARYADRAYDAAVASGQSVVLWQSVLIRSALRIARGEPARAAALLDESEPLFARLLPAGHVGFAAMRLERALVAHALGDDTRARQSLDEAIDIVEASIALGHEGDAYLPVLLLRRAEMFLDGPQQAERDARRALEGMLHSAGPGTYSYEVGEAWLALGRALAAQPHRDAEARDALRAATLHFEDSVGADHPTTRAAHATLAALATTPNAATVP